MLVSKYGYIYKTIDAEANKIYIGQRKGCFDPEYLGSGIHLVKRVEEVGKGKFKLEVIAYAESRDQLNELEKKFIREYRSVLGKESLYNIADGGHTTYLVGDDNPSKRMEVREKISAALKGRVFSDETKRKMRKNHFKKMSKASSEKKSKALKAFYSNPDNKIFGRKMHENCAAAIKKANAGNAYALGHKHSIEFKQRMSEIMRAKNNPHYNPLIHSEA